VASISEIRRSGWQMTRRRGVRPALGALALAGVAGLALLDGSDRRERLDQGVGRFAQRLRRAVRLSAVVARAPHQALATGVVTGAAVVLLARSRGREAGRLVLAAALGAATSVGLKRLLRLPRPAPALRRGPPQGVPARREAPPRRSRGGRPIEHSGRFPSGHTTSAAIAALALSRALAGTGPVRVWGTAMAAAAALAVGGSRVHLAEHYASDVLASYGIVLAAGLAVPRTAAAG
jgi:membrane-associated phospholipid phosphatase